MTDINVDVTDDPVSITVSNAPGPAGAAGSSGVITVNAPITNSGTSSAANLSLSIGSGLSIVGGALTAAAGGYTLPAATASVLGGVKQGANVTIDGAGVISVAAPVSSLAWGAITGKPNFATVATTGAYSDLSGTPAAYTLPTASSTVLGGIKVGSGLSIDGAGVVTAAGTYTLPNATTSTLGGMIVGTGLAVASGTVSVAYGTSSSTACAGNDARLSDAREWSAATVSQATAEAGTDTTRVAWTVLRVWQAIAAWWAASAAKTKLDGIASGATANSSDATLLARANHTGTQAVGTITGLAASATTDTTNAANIGSGTLPFARIPTGSTSTTVCIGNDSRLSDSRSPTTHTHGNLTNAGAIGSTSGLVVVTTASGVLTTAATISAATQVSGLATIATSGSASDLGSGTVPVARLGSSGTASSSTYLRGDNTWATVSGGISDGNKGDVTVSASGATWTINSGAVVAADIASAAFASKTEAENLVSTTQIMSPLRFRDAMMLFRAYDWNASSVTNSGSSNTTSVGAISILQTTTTTNGTVVLSVNSPGTNGTALASRQGISGVDWSRPQSFFVRVYRGVMSTNAVFRVQRGVKSTILTFAQMSGRGIGFEARAGALWIICHDGTTLTQFNTGLSTPADNSNQCYEIQLESDGAGNVRLTYQANGAASTATTTGGPTTSTTSTSVITAELTNGSDATAVNCWVSPVRSSTL